MARYGSMFGPDVTFVRIPACDLGEPAPYDSAEITAYLADRVVLEAPSGICDRRR